MLDTRTLALFVAVAAIVLVCAVTFYLLKRRSTLKGSSHSETQVGAFEYRSQLLGTEIEIKENDQKLLLSLAGNYAHAIPYSSVLACEIVANGTPVHRITHDHNDVDEKMLQSLLEELLKLRKHRLRKEQEIRIDLEIQYDGSAANVHKLNFYYRVGNHRVTRESLEDSGRLLLGWYRFLASEVLATSHGVQRSPSPEQAKPVDTGGSRTPHETSVSLAGQLERLASLRRDGFLTEEEFQQAKTRLLSDK